MRIRSNPIRLGGSSPLRFLSEVNVDVPAGDFEDAVRGFVEAVTLRIESFPGECADGLHELVAAWCHLSEEIDDPVLSFDRAIEARMGFEPEEAEPALLGSLRQATLEVGRSPVEELAAASKASALKDFETLWRDARGRSRPMRLGITPGMKAAAAHLNRRDLRPWKKGSALAEVVRREWAISSGAVDNQGLAQLCDVSPEWIHSDVEEETPIPAGFRNSGDADRLLASLKKRHPTGRRFALARIIGDHLLAGTGDRLLPVTDAATDRQQFQRAFAQAFLCPFEALRDHLGSKRPDDDFIEDAAQHFNVFSWLVRSALINHGVLSPAAVAS